MQPFELPDFYVPWPARLNPNLETARTHSKTWAREMGILAMPEAKDDSQLWDKATFDQHNYALFCAYVHPEAPSAELNLMTDWNVWAFYVDDYFLEFYKRPKDHVGAKAYLDRMPLFMPVDLRPMPEPTNPMERGLADLWRRTAPTKSEAWRSRLVEDTKNLMDAFLWELDSLSQQRLANPLEYIEMRRQVGAALWSADLVEHAMFVEIPHRIAAARPMQVLKNTFADGVHLRNDIFSYQREVLKEGELTNAVLVIERFLEVEPQRAANLVNDLLTARLQQFEYTVFTELEPLFEEYRLDPLEQANVLNYIRGLQDWQSGAHEWHLQTSRYLNPRAGQTSAAKGFPVGAAAMRITPGTLGLNRFKNYHYVPYQKVGLTPLPKFYMPFTTTANSHLDRLRQHSKMWARQMGMLDPLPNQPGVLIWDERRFDVTDLAFFNALSHPNATATQLELAECWLVWSTYADDYFLAIYGRTHDLAGAKIFYTRLLEFMPLEATPLGQIPLTPVERGLADAWERTIKTLSASEQLLFRKIIESLISSWVWELSGRVQNHLPDPIEYIEMRRKTSGVDLLMVLHRAVYGQAVPLEVHRTCTLKELNNTAIDYACWTNDIISYQREIEFDGELHNGVLVIQNFMGCDRGPAVEIVNQLMTARMQQFEHLVNVELPVLFENFSLNLEGREALLAYVIELQYFMSATLQWHLHTGRYLEGELRRATTRPFTGYPTGLGTAAARAPTAASGHKDINGAAPCPAGSGASPVKEEPPETLKGIKTIAVSHLALPFQKRKEEARTDS